MTMDAERLKQACENSVTGSIYLNITMRSCPKHKNVRLMGYSGGPSGEICNVKKHASNKYIVLACFNCSEVLEYIRRF